MAEQETVRVRISYAPERERIGTIEELPRAHAAAMVAEGCAVYVDASGEPIQRVRPGTTRQPATGRPLLTPPPGQTSPGSPDEPGPGPDSPAALKTRGNNDK